MNKKFRQAADAAAIVTAIETDDFSENTARKLSVFADVFMREIEKTVKSDVYDIKTMGEDIDRIGTRPSVHSRGKVVCINEDAFFNIVGEAIARYEEYMTSNVNPDAAKLARDNTIDFIAFLKNAMFGGRK